jgi:hypothetical protein
MRESWGIRLDAAVTLLEAAEAALNRAEDAPLDSDERQREVALFELLLASARQPPLDDDLLPPD